MSKKYNPKYSEFFVPFTLLVLCVVALIYSFNTTNTLLKIFLIIPSIIIIILWAAAKIIRIFLKIFLEQIKEW